MTATAVTAATAAMIINCEFSVPALGATVYGRIISLFSCSNARVCLVVLVMDG